MFKNFFSRFLYVVGMVAMVDGYILKMAAARLLLLSGGRVFLWLLDGLVLVVGFARVEALVAVDHVVLAVRVILQRQSVGMRLLGFRVQHLHSGRDNLRLVFF